MEEKNTPRIGGFREDEEFSNLVDKYNEVPEEGKAPGKVIEEIGEDLFLGIPRWESPKLQLNVGTAPNMVGLAAYTLSLKNNIYAIHEGLAGDSLAAEEAVTRLMGKLAGVETTPKGFFIFGGTATNLYSQKMGLNKALPDNPEKGVNEDVKTVTSKDSHFSHEISLNWLGMGRENCIVIDRGEGRRSDIRDAEEKMREAIESGTKITTIAINGGTTFNHLVDDVKAFRDLRDEIVEDYSLDYEPHLHVDTVIGASWLFFEGYDFEENPLDIKPKALEMIKEQYERVSEVKYADSWSFDFHKGIGACPIDCSIFIVNDQRELQYLAKDEDVDMSQLSKDFSSKSPGDFTLENSRPSGPALAALASIRFLGLEGYRRNLANLIEQTNLMRDLFEDRDDAHVCHRDSSLGFVTMLRLYPPEITEKPEAKTEVTNPSEETKEFSQKVNEYLEEFFAWEKENRMKRPEGTEFAYASPYTELSNGANINAVKLYPVSPYFDEDQARQAVETIMERKKVFDEEVWDNGES